MSQMHSSPDRVVWFDLPVADLERASRFYSAVLGLKVSQEKAGNFQFAVLEHGPDGNGGCLVPNGKEVSPVGILVYMNVDGRIRDALRQAEKHGGKVLKAIEGIGPHGFRAIVLDSEGNRIALHSTTDS
ncbi:MAG TPA: VOC family protein [Burkholderiales bacterium]|nr:VOC family protein [Burkholderiales bacterium]